MKRMIFAGVFIAGSFIDALGLILLTIPIFYPVVMELGYAPIWFGVNVYVVSGMERDVPLQSIFRGAMPFLLALVVAAAILMLFPALCTFLPNLVRSF